MTAAATAIVVLTTGYSNDSGMLAARLLDTGIGIAVGLLVNLAVWPPLRDRGAAFLEATRLAGFSAPEARRFFGPPPALSPALERDYLTPWPAGTAEKRFLERFQSVLRN